MKKKLIDALTTKFPGVDAKDLGRIADNILRAKTLTTDEDVNSAVEEVTFADILKSYGDSRAAEASKSAVSNYEKKYGLKDGKAVQTDDDDPDDDEPDNNGNGGEGDGKKPNAKKTPKPNKEESELATLLKKLDAKLDAQAAEIASMKKGEVSKSRKARIAELIKDLSEVQKKAYNRIPVDDLSDEAFETLVTDITGEVGELSKENKAGGGIFGLPLGGDNHGNGEGSDKGAASEAELKAVMEGFNL